MFSLDGTMPVWLAGILFTGLGAVLGSMVTYLMVARQGRTRQLQTELDQFKERFSDYRDQVTQHFMRTSELVQEMTQSYRAVYEHLALGAQNLCGGQIEAPPRDNTASEALAGDGDAPALAGDDLENEDLDLTGDIPRISDLDIKAEMGKRRPVRH